MAQIDVTDTGKDKLIVALDVETADRALALFEELRSVAGMFKIGSQLFTAAGPDIVREIVAKGGKIFLDLKFHDIPNTVAAAGVEATRLGVSIFNVHASGGMEMMKRTAAAVSETALREGIERPKVIAVTLLTSIDDKALGEIGVDRAAKQLVTHLARAAADSALDGVVASPQEIELIRAAVPQKDFLIVTPGIRSANAAADDQRRTMTAAEAVRAGADYLVVGRPITSAADRVEAARRLVSDMAEALA
ncbi:MAG TPA: orotidine-5'-phosphate decarboxylase [Pyrinomonadaceae bacterium]